eukprot:11388242-Karenia_brevis.AAC.1
MRTHVPVTNCVTEGLRSPQHHQRSRDRPFAGVNTMFFGDVWQLKPTGSQSVMSNPCANPGDPA